MLKQIRKKIDEQLKMFLHNDELALSLAKSNLPLYKELSKFVLSNGKRIRPALFVLAYEGLVTKKSKSIYKTAVSFELLHDFFLVHDDIIDRSDLRRGVPSIHKRLSEHLKGSRNTELSGTDLAIISGDILFSLALKAFLSSETYSKNSHKALNKFINCSFYTEIGEYIEMLESIKNITQVKKEDIYKIYKLKTAMYTFSYPLSIGAELACAPAETIKGLFNYGIAIGIAFQIKDDILGLFAHEEKSGKSSLSDLNEAKKTLLIWKAFQTASLKDKKIIQALLGKTKISKQDLDKMRSIVEKTGSLTYAKKEINRYYIKSQKLLSALKMKNAQKQELCIITKNILGIKNEN
ncbi:MAG: polyprenyl synthetase family protein [Candidatus Kappaea frigidicola]|nr:polyprenyl synthetase family protein [Candidatus Kappaea frigidicola]